jgi:hypothetical protein
MRVCREQRVLSQQVDKLQQSLASVQDKHDQQLGSAQSAHLQQLQDIKATLETRQQQWVGCCVCPWACAARPCLLTDQSCSKLGWAAAAARTSLGQLSPACRGQAANQMQDIRLTNLQGPT